VVVRTRLFDRTATVADVPLVASDTFYARRGDVFAWACFLSALLLTLEPVRWRRLVPRRGRRVG
jgi:apolipoprotein N-acyltransferase